MTRVDAAVARPQHPSIYLILILPFGVCSGFVTVTLAYQLTQGGVNAAQFAGVLAADLLPQTWKFLWAPLTDTTLNRKSWYVIGAALTAAGILVCGLVPPVSGSLPLVTALVFLMSLATTLLAMSVDASGWLQAGNLGGNGVGGGAGLWMAQHLTAAWISPAVLAAACAACTLALVWIPEATRSRLHAVADPDLDGFRNALARQWSTLVALLKDVWAMVRSRRGFLALLVVFLPIGTGAASNLWAAVADGWHASADTVALVNGTLGGLASVVGCLIGGFCCDRLDRKTAYLLYGAAQALCAVAMAVAPHTEATFAAFTILYAVLNGMAYAGFSAVALETIGPSAAATQYNVFASLTNTPILYMGLAEGWAYTRFGPSGMLYVEAVLAAAAIAIFATASAVTSRRSPAVAA
jgi:PAT family beta-lactamase induction signal transducer AmpG